MEDIEQRDTMLARDQIKFLADNLTKQIELIKQLETRASMTLAFAGVILIYSLNILKSDSGLGVIVLLISTMISVVFSFMAISVPRFFRKKHQKESVFYHTAISRKKIADYVSEMIQMSKNLNEVLEHYCLEIHNLTFHSIQLKKSFARYAVQILTFGFIFDSIYLIIKHTF